jgi:hypothetical protein
MVTQPSCITHAQTGTWDAGMHKPLLAEVVNMQKKRRTTNATRCSHNTWQWQLR